MVGPSVGADRGSDLVVEEGLRGGVLVAVLLACLPDRPPYLRINASLLAEEGRRLQVLGWARRMLAANVTTAVLCGDQLEELCYGSAQASP